MKSTKSNFVPDSQRTSAGVTRDLSNQAAAQADIDNAPSHDVDTIRLFAPNTQSAAASADDLSLSADADTIRLVALEYNEKLSIDEGPANSVAAPFDPYNNTSGRATDNRPRKSIDDLRKLSAEITRAKQYTPKRK